MFIDGLMIGGLRGGPNAFLTDWTFDPYLNSIYYTWYQMWTDTWSNLVGNAVEAAITSSLALRVARSVVPSIGGREAVCAPAGEQYRRGPLGVGKRRQPLEFSGAGTAAPDVDAPTASGRHQDDGAPGLSLSVGPVPEREAVRRRQGIAHRA